jgi:hypothetical protein
MLSPSGRPSMPSTTTINCSAPSSMKPSFRNLYQGDLYITDYCAKLKSLANNLRDVGQPVSELSQLLNLLRGLNPKYRHVISAITLRHPSHMFLSARSHLLMEEIFDTQCAMTIATHALLTKQGPSSQHSAPPAPPTGYKNVVGHGSRGIGGGSGGSTGGNGGGDGNKKNSEDRGSGSVGGMLSGSTTDSPAPYWWPTFNPLTGMVQAWPMPFWAPGARVLEPHPGFQPHQAMYVGPGPTDFV